MKTLYNFIKLCILTPVLYALLVFRAVFVFIEAVPAFIKTFFRFYIFDLRIKSQLSAAEYKRYKAQSAGFWEFLQGRMKPNPEETKSPEKSEKGNEK